MKGRYSKIGNVVQEDIITEGKGKFDWVALSVWLGSLVASLLPIYVSALQYIRDNNAIDTQFWYDCFIEYDILWVFGTVLLFVCINPLTGMIKNKSSSPVVNALTVGGLMLFIVTEATWLVFKYTIKTGASWMLWLGCSLIVLILIISTPLQINFIKSEG